MNSARRVLCLGTNEEFVSRVSAPLELAYPEVSVLTVTDVDNAIEVLEDEPVDCVVSDHATAASAPALFEAIRDRHPERSLLLLTPYDADGNRGTVVAEVVEFLDEIGQPGSDDPLGTWVANAVVGGPHRTDEHPVRYPDDVVRDVKGGLVDARRPTDIESVVCERLVRGDRYAFAWVGEYDRGESQVVPWATAARAESWSRARTFPVGGDTETVVDRALKTRKRQLVDESELVDGVPWAETARERHCTAAAFFPLVSSEELFGLFGVYTDDPNGFAEAELEALSDVAETTAYVLEGMAIRGRIDQQERTLRRYERLVETVGDGMYALDDEGHFMTINDALCSMTGYAREGILGEHIGLVLDDEDAEEWRSAVEELRAAGSNAPRSLELSIRRKDGTAIPCENKVALLPTEDDGGFRGTVGVLRDITERKQRERELRRQNERLDAFASIVSHDLRNPLSVAQGYLDIVTESTDVDAVDDVQYSLDRMEEIIDDVLALARNGQAVTDPEPVDLETVAERAWNNVSTMAATLVVASSVTIVADRSRLLRALENLFRNAIEHGGDDVTVRVGRLDDAEPAGFYVEDDGPGLDPAAREQVFESSFTTTEDGLGIGLWVVSEVADAHGWSATAAPGREGGARFEFTDVAVPQTECESP